MKIWRLVGGNEKFTKISSGGKPAQIERQVVISDYWY